jgi:hypothetical protein
MSSEQSPTRQHQGEAPSEIANDLLVGAGAIAVFVYGEETAETKRNIYRNVLELPLLKHGNALAAFKSQIVAEFKKKKQEALETRHDRKAAETRARTNKNIKPRRRLARRTQNQTKAA